MVVKIQRSAASARQSLDYNERKAAEGTACVVAASGLDPSSIASVYLMLQGLEENPAVSAKAERLGFHMSINPGPDDRTAPERIPDLVRDIMEELGYGNQPWIVYRHEDTGRVHWHVVSTRVAPDGHIISDSFERRRLMSALQRLGPGYGFVIGRDGARRQRSTTEGIPQRLDTAKGDVTGQMKEIIAFVSTLCVTSERQADLLLSHFGLKLIRGDGAVLVQGLDGRGSACTPPVNGKDLGLDIEGLMREMTERGRREHPMKRRERARVAGIVRSLLPRSTSQLHFERMAAKTGVIPVIARNRTGDISGVTWIDLTTRCVFKGSELGEGIGAAALREAEASGQWKSAEVKDSQQTGVSTRDEDENLVSDILDRSLTAESRTRERDMRKKRKKGHTL